MKAKIPLSPNISCSLVELGLKRLTVVMQNPRDSLLIHSDTEEGNLPLLGAPVGGSLAKQEKRMHGCAAFPFSLILHSCL